jgi:DNA-directed RNA polymerase subunit RPC12/RpoP
MEQFCTFCNKETRMEIVGLMEGIQGKAWFRCTRCHHTSLLQSDGQDEKSHQKIDPATATPYSPLMTFKVGEAIYHNEWNDVGKVVSKAKMSDGNQSIIVSFEKCGSRRLIENVKPESVSEIPTLE